MDQQTLIVIGAAVVALIAAIFIVHHQMQVRRRAALDSAALGMGFEFAPEKSPPPGEIAGLRIVSHGRAHTLRNAIRGRRGDTSVLLADHHYVTGSGKNQSSHSTALVVLRRIGLELPHFFMRPQVPVIDRIGKLFGGKDIDFEGDTDFSRAFVLQGEDEDAIRALFGPAARHQALQIGKGVKAEGRGDTLLIERARRVDAAEVPLVLDAATAFLDVLAGGSRSSW